MKVSERAFDAMHMPAIPDAGIINSRGVIIYPDRVQLRKGKAAKIQTARAEIRARRHQLRIDAGAVYAKSLTELRNRWRRFGHYFEIYGRR